MAAKSKRMKFSEAMKHLEEGGKVMLDGKMIKVVKGIIPESFDRSHVNGVPVKHFEKRKLVKTPWSAKLVIENGKDYSLWMPYASDLLRSDYVLILEEEGEAEPSPSLEERENDKVYADDIGVKS